MKLNYPHLDLPDSEESVAFDAIEQILTTDPALSSVTQLFVAWRGDVEDLWEPTVSTCPFLRISPGGMASGWEQEGAHKMPMSIAIEAAVVGSDRRQIMNYWGAIRRALWPQGDAVRRDANRIITQGANICRPILTAPSYGCIEIGEAKGGSRITLASGTLELVLLINTP